MTYVIVAERETLWHRVGSPTISRAIVSLFVRDLVVDLRVSRRISASAKRTKRPSLGALSRLCPPPRLNLRQFLRRPPRRALRLRSVCASIQSSAR